MDPGQWVIVGLALAFTVTLGLHDTSNAVATSIASRALTPRVAVVMAAVANLVGAAIGYLSPGITLAETVGTGLVRPDVDAGPAAVGALVGAIAWNLATWWRGMPSSSSHALLGGLLGGALATGVTIRWETISLRVLLPFLLSPVVALTLAVLVVAAVLRLLGSRSAVAAAPVFRLFQTGSAAAIALGHGAQSAAKAAGIVAIARGTTIHLGHPPHPVILALFAALFVGTLLGGWPVIRTLGERITRIDPMRGFAAEVSAVAVLYPATLLGVPVSSTHVVASSIVGTALASPTRSVNWAVVRRVVLVWLLTVPACALAGAAVAIAVRAAA